MVVSWPRYYPPWYVPQWRGFPGAWGYVEMVEPPNEYDGGLWDWVLILAMTDAVLIFLFGIFRVAGILT